MEESSIRLPANPISKFQANAMRYYGRPVNCVRFSPSGSYCLTASYEGSLMLWNPYARRMIKSFGAHTSQVLGIDISDDNSNIASGSADKKVFYWDIAEAKVIRRYSGHVHRVNSVKFNRDSNCIASASFDATIKLWDVRDRSRDPIQILSDASDSISQIDVNNYEVLGCSIDGSVRNYDLRMGMMNEYAIGKPVTFCKYALNNECIIASCLDNAIRLIDKRDGRLLNHFIGHENHQYRVESCLDYTESQLISGSENGHLFFWDLLSGNLMKKVDLDNDSKPILSVCSHNEQNYLLTASSDGQVILWGE